MNHFISTKLLWLTLLSIHSFTINAQQSSDFFVKITLIEVTEDFKEDTTRICISHLKGNWFKVTARLSENKQVTRRIHRHRLDKFEKKFNLISEKWDDCDSCPISTITMESKEHRETKRSPTINSRPDHMKHILKIWK